MNTITVSKISVLAVKLGIAPGQLLKMAREVEQNGQLPSLAHMTRDGLEILHLHLLQISAGRWIEKAVMRWVKA